MNPVADQSSIVAAVHTSTFLEVPYSRSKWVTAVSSDAAWVAHTLIGDVHTRRIRHATWAESLPIPKTLPALIRGEWRLQRDKYVSQWLTQSGLEFAATNFEWWVEAPGHEVFGEDFHQKKYERYPLCADFSPDDHFLAVAWESEENMSITKFDHWVDVWDLFPDGVGTFNPTCVEWCSGIGREGPVTFLSFTPTSSDLIVSTSTGLECWTMATGERRWSIDPPQ